jgi:hypothetical protein
MPAHARRNGELIDKQYFTAACCTAVCSVVGNRILYDPVQLLCAAVARTCAVHNLSVATAVVDVVIGTKLL